MKKTLLLKTRLCFNLLLITPLMFIIFAQPFRAGLQQEPVTAGRCVGQCTSDKLRDIASDLAYASSQGDKTVIRLCSKEKFEVAVAKAWGNLLPVIFELKETHKLNTDLVDLILSDNCLKSEGTRQVAADFLILSGKSLPSYSKVIKLKDISVTVIGFVPITKEMVKDYPSKAYDRFVKLLRQKPNAHGMVIGYYNRRSTKTLENKVRKIEKQMGRMPDLRGRYTVDLLSYGYFDSDWNFEPEEPVFYIIEVAKLRK